MSVRTDNFIVIDAPLDEVWRITNDVPNWPNLFTEYATAEILEQNADTIRFRLTMHPDAQGKVWSWVSERTVDARNHTVKARRVETGPFEFMNIEWYYQPVEGGSGTKMRWVQEFTMKPGAPANDEQMEQYINNNTKTQMAIIKERIEQGMAT
jgi:aromatase